MGAVSVDLYVRGMSQPTKSKPPTHPRRAHLGAPLLLLTSCAAVGGHTSCPPGASHACLAGDAERYDAHAVVDCLAHARKLMTDHTSAFAVMTAALEQPLVRSRQCRSMNRERPFAAFEGWWQGRWNDIETKHLWLTVEPGVQLVLLSNDGVISKGINLVSVDQEICGIVEAPDGSERLHQGRFVEASGHRAAHLKWFTPDRNYTETVTCDDGERRYEIVEEIFDRRGARRGTAATYAPPTVMGALTSSPFHTSG